MEEDLVQQNFREGSFTNGFIHGRRCRYGNMIYNINDAHIGRSLELYGEWAELEMELLRCVLKPSDVVLDVGSNIGTHTMFFAHTVGPEGKVYAFEPQRFSYQILCTNLTINCLQNVHAYHMAVGSEKGTIIVPELDQETEMNYGGVSLDTNQNGESVPLILLDELEIDSCRLIKIDVEGMELSVLKGGTGMIEKCNPFIYLENNDPSKSFALIKYIKTLGYTIYWHFSPFYNPDNFYRNKSNVFENIVDANMFCVRTELKSSVQGLLKLTNNEETPADALNRFLSKIK